MKKPLIICLALALSLVSILDPSITAGTTNSPKGKAIDGPPRASLSATTRSLPTGEFPICTDPAKQYAPTIFGAIVVWMDRRNDNWDIWDIYGYDLSTQTEFPITIDPGDQRFPGISGDIVVWQDSRNSNWDIYGYDLSTQTEFPICTDSANQSFPAISGDIVVWLDERTGNGDIYGYDLSTQTEFPICTDPANQRGPAIWGDTVVWQDSRNSNWDIYGYDLPTQTEFPICTDPANQGGPAIWGDTVVWQDWRNPVEDNAYYCDVYGYDLPTHTEYPITIHPATQEDLAISGDIVVWSDYRNGPGAGWGQPNTDIYGYELSTQTEFPIVTALADQDQPAISGDILVWQDERNGNGNLDIYGRQIVHPIVALIVDPCSLSFLSWPVGENPLPQNIDISNAGSAPLDWTAIKDADWLSISPSSGTTPSTMTVSVDTSALTRGYYTGRITISGITPGTLNSPQVVEVQLAVDNWVSGTIVVDTTWTVADSPYIVTGDLTVSEGVTLTIEPGVEVRFTTTDDQSSGEDPDKVELIIGGTLVADGATFTLNADSPAGGDWYGIRFLDSSVDYGDSGCIIENSTIEYGTVGISINGASPLISNNTITEIKGNNADSDRDAGDGVGILVTNGSSPTITDNIISSVRGGDGSMSLYYPSKDSGDGYGICVRNDSSAVIARNTISYVTGAPGQCNYVYVAGYASGRGIGILVVSSSPTIADNTVSNIEVESCCGCPGSTGAGIYLEASSPTIGNNSISLVSGGPGVPGGIGAGIFADNASSPAVAHNTISDIQGGDGENARCLGSACQYGGNYAADGGLGVGIYVGTNSALTTDANILSLISGGKGGNGTGYDPWCDGLTLGGDGGIGAGICAVDSSLDTSNSIIYLTRGGDGGAGAPCDWCGHGDGGDGGLGIGVYVEGSSATLVNNTIASSSGGLGGASGGGGASPGSDGSGVGVDVASTVGLTNNIVVSHTIGISGTASAATLSYNDVWGNSEANYSGVAPGTNDISADPLFVDPANNDYHLQCGSPAIDAGTNESAPPTDFEGDPRPLDGNSDGIAVVDMGADEFKPIPIPTPRPPIPVGGAIVGVSKFELLAPWICLGLLALVAGILLVRRHMPGQG